METIEFNKNIYSLEAVNKAIEEYQELAEFTVAEKDDKIEVTLDNIDEEVKAVIKDEFANYVLGLMS